MFWQRIRSTYQLFFWSVCLIREKVCELGQTGRPYTILVEGNIGSGQLETIYLSCQIFNLKGTVSRDFDRFFIWSENSIWAPCCMNKQKRIREICRFRHGVCVIVECVNTVGELFYFILCHRTSSRKWKGLQNCFNLVIRSPNRVFKAKMGSKISWQCPFNWQPFKNLRACVRVCV